MYNYINPINTLTTSALAIPMSFANGIQHGQALGYDEQSQKNLGYMEAGNSLMDLISSTLNEGRRVKSERDFMRQSKLDSFQKVEPNYYNNYNQNLNAQYTDNFQNGGLNTTVGFNEIQNNDYNNILRNQFDVSKVKDSQFAQDLNTPSSLELEKRNREAILKKIDRMSKQTKQMADTLEYRNKNPFSSMLDSIFQDGGVKKRNYVKTKAWWDKLSPSQKEQVFMDTKTYGKHLDILNQGNSSDYIPQTVRTSTEKASKVDYDVNKGVINPPKYGEFVQDLGTAGAQLLVAPLAVPQATMVEGIEALRGNDYDFSNVYQLDKQRRPTDTFGKSLQGTYPGMALDMMADPLAIPGYSQLAKGLGRKATQTVLKNTYRINPFANKTVPQNTLYHNSKSPNLTLDDIDVLRTGKSQLKRKHRNVPENELPSGFYTSDQINYGFMGGNEKYSFNIPADAKVKDLKALGRRTDRLSKSELKQYIDEGYDIIRGKNMIGADEYIVLNKDKMTNFNRIGTKQDFKDLPRVPTYIENPVPHWLKGYQNGGIARESLNVNLLRKLEDYSQFTPDEPFPFEQSEKVRYNPNNINVEKYLNRDVFNKNLIPEDIYYLQEELSKRGHIVTPEFLIAQAQAEGALNSQQGKSKETNPYNVYEFDSGTKRTFKTKKDGLDAYLNVLDKQYLQGRTEEDLLNNYVNLDNNRYASNPDYEKHLKNQMEYIRKRYEKGGLHLNPLKSNKVINALSPIYNKKRPLVSTTGSDYTSLVGRKTVDQPTQGWNKEHGGTTYSTEHLKSDALKPYYALEKKLAGLTMSPDGYHANPNGKGWAVPTNGSITMKDVPMPIIGESVQTGEKKYMMPNKEYFFKNTNMVLEKPVRDLPRRFRNLK